MKLRQLVFMFGSLCFFSIASVASGDWSEDFESQSTGTSLFDLGYETGGYENSTVQNVGRNGSKGIEVQPDSNDFFPSAKLEHPGTLNVGDRLSVSVDLRMRNGGLGIGDGGAMYVTVANLDGSDYVGAGFSRHAVNSSDQYLAYLYDLGGLDSSAFAPVAELGLANNQTGDWTDWLSIQLDVHRISSTSYALNSSLLGPTGNLLQANSMSPQDLSALFDGTDKHFGFGHDSSAHQTSDLIQVDNFSITTTSVPEPSGAMLMAFAVGLGFVRTRSRS